MGRWWWRVNTSRSATHILMVDAPCPWRCTWFACHAEGTHQTLHLLTMRNNRKSLPITSCSQDSSPLNQFTECNHTPSSCSLLRPFHPLRFSFRAKYKKKKALLRWDYHMIFKSIIIWFSNRLSYDFQIDYHMIFESIIIWLLNRISYDY